MLHWHAILWARENGYRYYDFGGYWEVRGDADPINRFKTGFSKEIQRFVPEHVLLIKPLAAKSYLALARAKARVSA
jgi:lipid II:glycine glycyltransferase (peptidoglycan interpeptide bridge formation enzyme)